MEIPKSRKPRTIKADPGLRFGRWTILAEVEKRGNRRMVKVVCDCGKQKIVNLIDMNAGKTRSCGCLRVDGPCKVHGASYTPEYQVWKDMIARCHGSRKVPGWENYGGRGITVCDEWRHSFQAFLDHVGKRPSPKHSIDRIDNDLGYFPKNVKWSTRREQNLNKRTKLTRDQKAELVRLYESGVKVKDLTAQYGFRARTSLRRALNRLGIGIRPRQVLVNVQSEGCL